ncbi:hypothetical protein ACTXT7_007659 [Hymenolepis weldensis]
MPTSLNVADSLSIKNRPQQTYQTRPFIEIANWLICADDAAVNGHIIGANPMMWVTNCTD